jgi:hypothetical protein
MLWLLLCQQCPAAALGVAKPIAADCSATYAALFAFKYLYIVFYPHDFSN